MLLLLAACSDSTLVPKGDDTAAPYVDSDSGESAVDSGPPEETAHTGETADTAPPPCDVTAAPAGDAPMDGHLADYWDLEVLWEVRSPAAYPTWNGSIVTPLVVQLGDDDGDGDVDAGDDPDVLALFTDPGLQKGALVALDGATGAELWAFADVYPTATFAAVDLDLDGVTEIVLNGPGGTIPRALRADGTLYWDSGVSLSEAYMAITAADLDQDGFPEVLANGWVLDGRTGAVGKAFADGWGYGVALGADLDGDGSTEILLDGRVYGADGARRWASGVSADWYAESLPVQADGDPEAEVFTVAMERWEVDDTDGTPLVSGAAAAGPPGPPCAADLDGDGLTEVVWPTQYTLQAVRVDGTPLWAVPITDNSTASGCATADLDGNGAYEVIYADETALVLFDGTTGAELWRDETHSSGTLFEHPTIADLDHDGSPEIVQVGNFGAPAVRAWRQVDAAWAPTGSAWPIDDYAETQWDDDGVGLPGGGTPWLDWGGFRGRPPRGPAGVGCGDLAVFTPEVCSRGCGEDPAVILAFQPYNHGAVDLSGGRWSLAVEGGPTLAEGSFGAVASGRSTDGIRVELAPEQLVDVGALVITVSTDDAECSTEDNVARIEGPFCP